MPIGDNAMLLAESEEDIKEQIKYLLVEAKWIGLEITGQNRI